MGRPPGRSGPPTRAAGRPRTGDTSQAAYAANAAYWIEVVGGGRDRYRTDLTMPAVLDAIRPQPGQVIVDAGCGEGMVSRACAAAGAKVIGVDNCAVFIEAVKAWANGLGTAAMFEIADVAALPVRSDAADVVAAIHVLNDLAAPEPAIVEFARVLRPRGRLVALLLHPCFYGPQGERATVSQMPAAGDYFGHRVVSRPFVVDGETSPAAVAVHLYPLEDYMAWLARRLCRHGPVGAAPDTPAHRGPVVEGQLPPSAVPADRGPQGQLTLAPPARPGPFPLVERLRTSHHQASDRSGAPAVGSGSAGESTSTQRSQDSGPLAVAVVRVRRDAAAPVPARDHPRTSPTGERASVAKRLETLVSITEIASTLDVTRQS